MSKRTQILTKLDEQLTQISTANGYNNTLKYHTRGFIDYNQLGGAQFPATCLAVGSSSYTPLTNTGYTSGTALQSLDGWLVSTIGYVKAATQERIGDAIEDMVEDILKAVFTDIHLGLNTFVRSVTLQQINSYLDLEENVGVIEIIWAIKYDFERDDP